MAAAPGPRERRLIIFKWLLVPASVLVIVGVMGFILADLERMRTVRSIAVSVIAVACLLALVAAFMAWYGRTRH